MRELAIVAVWIFEILKSKKTMVFRICGACAWAIRTESATGMTM